MRSGGCGKVLAQPLGARLANMHAQLGDTYLQAGAEDEALEEYRKAAALRPQFMDIRNKLARTLIDMGRPDDAVAELETVLGEKPSFVAARANLGLAFYRAGRLDDAEREWRRCEQQQPDNAQISGFLGMLGRRRPRSNSTDPPLLARPADREALLVEVSPSEMD